MQNIVVPGHCRDAIPDNWDEWSSYQQRRWVQHQNRRKYLQQKALVLVQKMAGKENFNPEALVLRKRETCPECQGEERLMCERCAGDGVTGDCGDCLDGYIECAACAEPSYVIRAFYGPMMNLPTSRVIGLRYHESFLTQTRSARDTIGDELVNLDEYTVADVHSGAEKNIAVDEFEHWSQKVVHGVGAGPEWGPKEFLWVVFSLVAAMGADCVIFFVHSRELMQVDPKDFEDFVHKSQSNPVELLAGAAKMLEG